MKKYLLFYFFFFTSILSILAQTDLEFVTQDIASSTLGNRADGARDVHAVDLDGDGDTDILSASYLDDRITWYENDGNQNFTTHDIASTALGNPADGAQAVVAIDLDGDNDMDVISISYLDDRVTWYINDGNQSFTTQDIATASGDLDGPLSLVASDLDDDGDMDIIVGYDFNEQVIWYENNGSQSFIRNVIANSVTDVNATESIFITDLDQDGNKDILAAGNRGHIVLWFRNDGNSNFSPFDIASNDLGNRALGATSVFAVDMDGDNDIDVISTSSLDNRITWYENDGDQNVDGSLNFATHDIVSNALGNEERNTRDVIATDLDNDGDMDLVVAIAGISTGDSIKWFENDGNQNFTKYEIASILLGNEPSSAWRVFINDVDGDGDLDVLSASTADGRIAAYYSNQTTLSTNDFSSENISLYNFNNESIKINGLENTKASMKVYSILGGNVFSTSFIGNGNNTIDVPSLPSGLYIIRLKTEHGSVFSKKIVFTK